MKADPLAQRRLLDVQDLDARLDLLRHQLATLPENVELRALAAERKALDDQARDVQVRVEDLTREQRKSESDVEQVRTRRTRDQQRMDSGAVSNPKDLERMQHELVSLQRRIDELEDLELEVMARLEDAQKDLDGLRGRIAEINARATELLAARDQRAASVQEEVATATTARAVAAEGLPEDLVGLYDKLRAQKGGVGAAALRARRCTGCSLDLNASDLGVIAAKPADEVVRCEECSRILVRTPESGL